LYLDRALKFYEGSACKLEKPSYPYVRRKCKPLRPQGRKATAVGFNLGGGSEFANLVRDMLKQQAQANATPTVMGLQPQPSVELAAESNLDLDLKLSGGMLDDLEAGENKGEDGSLDASNCDDALPTGPVPVFATPSGMGMRDGESKHAASLADRRASSASDVTVLTVVSTTTIGRVVQNAMGVVSFGPSTTGRRRSSIQMLRDRVEALRTHDPDVPEDNLQEYADQQERRLALRKSVGLGRWRAWNKWKAHAKYYHGWVTIARLFAALHDSPVYGSIKGCMKRKLKGSRARYNFGIVPTAFKKWYDTAADQKQWREQSAQADEFRMYWGRLRVRGFGCSWGCVPCDTTTVTTTGVLIHVFMCVWYAHHW